jgi:hypothetical protein
MKDKFTNRWILENGIPIVESYAGNITLRALHYRLVAAGMTNDVKHYKKVVAAMTAARWKNSLAFDAFLDHERELIGTTEFVETDVESAAERAEEQIKAWATSYKKNRWENQPIYPEVFIEKKALQGVFERPCRSFNVALSPCKGYPSLTYLYEAKKRFDDAIAAGKEPIILYFGDYDCSGEDIPRSIQETLSRMGTEVGVRRIALLEDQVRKWKLPPAPTKKSDTRSHNWEGAGQVELDAVEPKKIVQLCNDAIVDVFDHDLHDELEAREEQEEAKFKKILLRDFKTLLD